MTKIVLFTSAPNGLPFLEELTKNLPQDLELSAVVICIDARNPHSSGVDSTCIINFCKTHSIDLHYSPDELLGKKYDLGLSFSNFFILKQNHLDLFKSGVINFHGAPVNQYRGSAATIFHILSNGANRFGYSYHLIEIGLDEGDIFFENYFEYDPKLNSEEIDSLVVKAALRDIPLLLKTIQSYLKNEFTLQPAQKDIPTRKRKELKDLEKSDFKINNEELYKLLKAFDWPQLVDHPQIHVNSEPVRLVPEKTYQKLINRLRSHS